MIIFLYGEDGYSIREKIKEIVGKYKKVHQKGLDLKYINSFSENPEQEFTKFKNSFRQTSMFKEKKLLVIEDPFSNSLLEKEILKHKDIFAKGDDIALVYKQGKIDSKNDLVKFLKKKAKSQEFKPLTGNGLKRWVKNEVNRNRGKISLQALESLIGYVGNDLWRLSQEINKLTNYKGGQQINIEDVRSFVERDLQTDIFKTIDAIGQKNKKKAINLLHEHLEKGDSPLYLLAMINYQFRNILLVKDFIEKRKPYPLLVKESGLHPFVVKKSASQSRHFTLEGLKKIYRTIFKVDLDIKTGQVVPELALDMLVAEI